MLVVAETQKHTKFFPALSAEETLTVLQAHREGLSMAEVKRRLEKYGPNVLSSKKTPLWKKLIAPFASVFVSVLILAMAISLVMNETLDAIVIGIVLAINAVIFYVQEYSANKVLETLKRQDVAVVDVKRDGKILKIPSAEIVPGDIIYLSEGVKIPADGRILESENLHVSEAVLTGESLPIHKTSEVLEAELKIYDQKNMTFKGTLVHSGSGVIVVSTTGNLTELGKISQLASQGNFGRAPIEKKIDKLTRQIVFGVSVVGVFVFTLALVRGISTSEALRFSLSLVVSVVPEGLPVALTVVLLFSAKRLAKVKALIKKLSSIETLGAVTLIATDKTGTLTKNKLSVAGTLSIPKNKADFIHAVVASLNGDKQLHSDPLDETLGEFFKEKMPTGWVKVKDYPFQQALRASGTLWKFAGKHYLYVKGAPESLLNRSKDKKKLDHASEELKDFTAKGYRTLAFAHKYVDGVPDQLDDKNLASLEFDGLIGLADELRDGIADSIREAREAGIKVVMLTGDHVDTASEISRNIGLIKNSSQVADSTMLEKAKTGDLSITLENIRVFGRILPEHKFNFLKALRGREITAMTGDGVNDIPALVEADAGLAMGSGTDAAKDASDIVLLDDNFKTIIEAVRVGRAVLANISKMLFYVISTSIGEVLTMVGALILDMPLPLTAVQILWINVVTDTFTVLPLGLSAPEHHQMKQPPNDPSTPLLNSSYISRMILTGLGIATVTLLFFNMALPMGHEYAATMAFLILAVTQWANALNANFENRSWTYNFVKPNRLLFVGIAVAVLFQVIAMYGPLSDFFGTVGLTTADLLLAIIVPTAFILILGDLHKSISNTLRKK